MVTGLNIIGSNKALQDHEIKRVVAYIIDWIIVTILSSILAAVAFSAALATGGFGVLFWGVGWLVFALLAILYWAVQEGFWGASLGKKIMGLRVVGTTGPLDIVKAVMRNVTKVFGLFLLLDWIVGLATEGDPRQKFSDRFAGTTVVRADQHAYLEEQFRQMATPPPHPQAPGYAPGWPGQQAPPPGYAPPSQQPYTPPPQQQAPPAQQSWPGQQQQPPAGGWPQHQWNEQGQLVQQARFCSNCGGPLVPRGDGRMVCSRCGAVY